MSADDLGEATPVAIVCSVCGRAGLLAPGPGGRPDASCTRCGSLERHRALAGILTGLADRLTGGCVADVAPSRQLSSRLRELAASAGVAYLGLDFDPAADGRAVNTQASLTQLPLRERSVSLMICFHVLEHIPDDRAAMAEIARVLTPGGVALVQVPRKEGVPTDEDPGAPVEERIRRFGQDDHVRWYGDDFEDRLRTSGLTVVSARMGELFEHRLGALLGIVPDEPIWLCTVGDPLPPEALVEPCRRFGWSVVTEGIAAVVRERDDAEQTVRRVRKRLNRAIERRKTATASEERLRRRLDVRLTTAVGRRVRRVLG